MNRKDRLEDHQKFLELAALAQRTTLDSSERLSLEHHLQICASCQRAFDEYSLISTEGMPFLAAANGYDDPNQDWDDTSVRSKLFAQIEEQDQAISASKNDQSARPVDAFVPQSSQGRWATVGLAACVLIAVATGAYHLGGYAGAIKQQPMAIAAHVQQLASEKKAAKEAISLQSSDLSRLQLQVVAGQREILRLRDAVHSAESRASAVSAANAVQDQQLHQVVEQRDKLLSQLRDAEQSYRLVQAELADLRAEHDKVLLRTSSLESKIDELTASSRDQERKLRDDETYLASDRDIRELMGARKLYIADVFDVDSGSRTRKPFGRVFYTQNKSLIFYAFDLDRQPGVKNASAFQVWGQRDGESGEKIHATNLGILYMDSESNRRWVLRLDDPKQLSELDAVFVTVEPQGGSQKPTGKPFLYALLRREANHP
jgi:hypothetical protein